MATPPPNLPPSAAAAAATKSPSRPQPPPPPSSSFPVYQIYPSSQNIPLRPQFTPKPQQSLISNPPYPLSSSGRGFIPRPARPPDHHHSVTVANTTNLPPHRPAFAASGSGSPASDSGFSQRPRPSYLQHPVHLIRKHPAPLLEQYMAASSFPPVKGIPFSGQLKASSSPLPVSDSNGYKNIRDRGRDDSLTVAMIRDRKVRILEDASLYALCRSWLRNGFPEESQPHNRDIVQVLPEPLPLSDVDIHSPKEKDDNEEENKEDEESVDGLSAQDLLRIHVKRAKKVRARLREGRLKRIARFKTRLAMLLPPQAEQFRNDTVTGN
ncbi:proline-rich family protein [Euphorbia peplus]|nr:proline-rich family protein [Euphorbia peplus]